MNKGRLPDSKIKTERPKQHMVNVWLTSNGVLSSGGEPFLIRKSWKFLRIHFFLLLIWLKL